MTSVQITWDETVVNAHMNQALQAGLRAAATTIKDEAVELTPRDTGDLRDSAGVDAERNRASVYYDEYYAPFVHEKLDHRHNVGQAKFLEAALVSSADRAMEDMARVMRAVIGD